jgi:hypothetical protein
MAVISTITLPSIAAADAAFSPRKFIAPRLFFLADPLSLLYFLATPGLRIAAMRGRYSQIDHASD